jgi:NitT/TauT family transport system permease protein
MTPARVLFLKSLLVPTALIVLWQVAAMIYQTPLFPGPLKVMQAIGANAFVIMRELGHTLWRAGAGFSLAAMLMLPLGIFLGRVRWLGMLFEPVVDMVATLPPVAIIPLVMLFAGTGDWAKIVIIAYAAAVPLLMNTYEASLGIHPMLSRVAKSLRLSRIETMRLIDLPASLPMIATGARLALASSFLVSVTSEILLSTNGIGVFLQRSQETFKIANGLAGILFISLAGLLINSLVYRLEKRWLFWHYRAGS